MFIYERVYGIPQAVAYLLENGMTIHWLYSNDYIKPR